ncbi:SemiSWEET transporter [Actinoplanes oblitus]|uniref:SemiSWEET transporter n=1 Tax=Actinoplanes oblitus TaxID=3040509 RepID=A0ABY8WCJ3_9ACTN|nr:SemiSWEET transporter [Actinoplanes oblitus]WIM95212.1 SemiSWEET transporter [Actinoplanes oblitus]
MSAHAFGLLGAALSMSIAWPQVFLSCVRRRTGGLSPAACLLGVVMPAGWLTYGLLIEDRIQVVTNALNLVAGVAVLIALLATQPRLRSARALRGAGGLAGAVLAAVGTAAASAALPQVTAARAAGLLGAVLAIGALLSALPQPLALLRNRAQDVSGLSPARFRLGAAASGSWLIYGLGTGQPAVWAAALVGLSSALTVCAVLTARRAPAEVAAIGTPQWRGSVVTRSLAVAGV